MRPNIPERLSKLVEQNYESAGYASETEFVNDAIRRRLEELDEL